MAEFSSLPKQIQKQVDGRIGTLAVSPRPAGVQKLQGSDKVYRLRSGDYRVIYEIDDASKTIILTRIRHRKEAYRNL
ncbi:MAG: type II toxin-antitoxin system RelE/ParE family toxin [Nitrospirae bacterium]|nr:type II toxin-antitoxin system RelE/ParE family toxin [Nitrospirota bacterium]